jgi:hypothetical protein
VVDNLIRFSSSFRCVRFSCEPPPPLRIMTHSLSLSLPPSHAMNSPRHHTITDRMHLPPHLCCHEPSLGS